MGSPAEDETKMPRKRQRLTLVCENCKRRKIKCDKGNPCNSCIKSNISDSCTYFSNWQATLGDHKPFNNVFLGEDPGADVKLVENNAKLEIEILKQKIQRLENLKMRLLALYCDVGASTALPRLNSFPTSAVPSRLPPPPPSADTAINLLPTIGNKPSPSDKKLSSSDRTLTSGENPENQLRSPVKPRYTASSPFHDARHASSANKPIIFNTSSPFSETKLPPINWKPKSRGTSPNDTGEDLSSSTSDTDLSNEPNESTKLNVPTSFSEKFHKQGNKFLFSPFEIITTSNYSPNFLVGINPVANQTETINFYEHCSIIGNKDPRRTINYGPFSWSSLMKRDAGLNLLWEYMIELESSKLLNVFGEMSLNKENIASKSCESKYDEMLKRWIEKPKNQAVDKYQLKNEILAILPPKRIIWRMVERYFIQLYPLLPFLDQEMFELQITKILGSKPTTNFPLQTSIVELNITSKNDFAILGILLAVLRLAFLSLFTNNEDKNRGLCNLPVQLCGDDLKRDCTEDINYLMENPISAQTIQLANDCLHLFPYHNSDNFLVLQLAFFIRLCNRFAPEDGDGADGADAQIGNAILMQMSYSLGLNREPSKFKTNNPKIENIMRKIWHFNMYADAYQSYTFGNPLSVSETYYDTKRPFSTKDNANIRNENLDMEINKKFCRGLAFLDDIKKVLLLLLNVEAHPKMIEVSEVLSNFETRFFNHYLTFEHCMGLDEEYAKESLRKKTANIKEETITDLELLNLTGVNDYESFLEANKASDIKTYISINSFLVSIYFHLYLHYFDKNHNLSFFYLKKTFMFILEIVPYYNKLLKMSTLTCDFVLNPTLLTSVHKSNQIFISLFIKINFIIFEMKKVCREHKDDKIVQNPNFYQYLNRLDNLKNSIVKISRYLISSVSSLSNRYFYAWRIAKAHSRILESLVLLDEFYRDTYGNSKLDGLKTPRYSSEQIKELQRIINDAILKTINYTNNEFRETYKDCKDVDQKWYNYASDNGKRVICLFDIFNDDY